MDSESNRRRFLGAVGLGTVAMTAGCTDILDGDDSSGDGSDGETEDDGSEEGTGENGSEDDHDVPDIDGGAVVFVYDDGPVEDYEQAFPVHQEFDAPASAGIVTEWVGREDYNDNDWMTEEQLKELADAGWEIMAHTTAHTALGEFELVEDVEPDDTRIYPEARNHGFHQVFDLEITDGDNQVRRTITGSAEDETGAYIEFDEPIGESFAAGETVERYPEDLMHEFLGDCKQNLESMGFEVDTLLAPYDIVDDRAVEFAEEYYDGIANVNPGSMINDVDDFDPFDTNRDYFIEFTTPTTVQNQLDQVAGQEGIGIIGAHTFKEEVTEEGIRETLEWVEERDLTVVTLRDAIRAAANADE
ncbi:polysaccharide deacetylase family protein [Halostagnicola sp. A-GB9-2]|uniref:polysaccharide deacetylase family protein n=1 Tax=Halostagnicola sp. A-GB9-2 TaxID=3048066 RepID=UPI0024C0DF01|nr:polysaccharide deacetylase family protein [Halostagnicola sp. A-GB9-2]MDJ1431857.1 polysaccharide deacetylase family protein [Halostagnicola sp. A-GB9-2]